MWGVSDHDLMVHIFDMSEPVTAAISATEKTLKCTGKRYLQAMELNNTIYTNPVLPAIQRYTGVMYKSLWYDSLSASEKKYIKAHVYILSWLRGILKPNDMISNYKLPVTTSLAKYRKPLVTEYIIDQSPTVIVNLLPGTYMKMVDWNKLESTGIAIYTPEFHKPDGSTYTHGIKKVRGERLREQSSNYCNK